MKNILIGIFIAINLFGAPRVGDEAVKFQLPNLYDKDNSLKSQQIQGKVVLLNLWASWCSGCQEEMPLFVELQKEYPKSEFEIVLSSIDNIPQSARDFLAKVDKERVLTSLYDGDKTLPKAYRCPGMPSSFLVGKDGKISEVYIGSLDDDAILQLKAKIKSLLGK